MSVNRIPRRVLFLTDTFGGIHGGTEGQLHTLASSLPDGWEAELWVLQDSEYLDQHGFPCPHRSLGMAGFRSPRLPLDVKAVGRAVVAGGFDLIHGFHADTCMLAPWIAREARIPAITSRRDLGYWQDARTLEVLRRANRHVHAILVNCAAVGARTVEVEHAHPARVHVIRNGHAPARFEAPADRSLLAKLGIPDAARVVGLLANVRPLKRQGDLIDAVAALGEEAHDVHVLLVGTGTEGELAALHAHAERAGLAGRVHAHGVTGDVVPWLRCLDIGVLASETEGLSNSIIEYMGCGLPVVASDVGGNPELVQHETSGLIFPPADVAALSAALKRLLDDPDLRARYGAAGRAHYESELTAERMVGATVARYEEVLRDGVYARPMKGPRRATFAWSLIRDVAELAELRPAWEALLDDRGFFLSPTWMETWWAWRDRRPYFLVAHDVNGELVGMLPLTELDSGVLGFAGQDEGADHLDVLARPGDGPAVARGALDQLTRLPWRRLDVRHVREEGYLRLALHDPRCPMPFGERLATVCPYVQADGTWDEFLASRMKRKRRHELRRAVRRFLERPGAKLHHVTKPREVAPALQALFALHKQRFASLGSASGFEGDGREAFHHALAPALLETNQLYLVRLRAGGVDHAVYYGFRSGGRLMHFQSGIDGRAQGTSPGTILRALAFERDVFGDGLFGDQINVFDFLDGDEAYKLDWATGHVRLFDITVRRRTLEGRLRTWLGGVTQLAKGEVRRWQARAQAANGDLATKGAAASNGKDR